ncbi:Fungal specific transcription [Mycena kentingensis (nom. inval.)]|nr:Fungal specific transcription [Mycena kentingensis (nom. inval.)]
MSDDHDDDQPKSATTQNGSAAASPPQIRSRITVVCAECKRLKLRCDRKTPCGSCVKRDTLARCVYSPAAAEKVDLHSLHNRLIQVEQLLAQGNSAAPAPPAATPGPPVPLTPLAIPLNDLHTACLAPLGLPTPSLPARARPDSPRHRPSSRINSISSLAATAALLELLPSPSRLPARLSAAHTALSAVGAAPFPFSWFEARAYNFISGLTASATSPPSLTATKAAANQSRKREREANRERAKAIFSGGAATNGAHNYANFPGYGALLNANANTNGASSSSSFQRGNTAYGFDGEAEPMDGQLQERTELEVDELEDAPDLDGVTLCSANGTGPRPKPARGDPRIAFFALLCGVLALSADTTQRTPEELAAADLVELAKRAAAEYFDPPTPFAETVKEEQRLMAEADAILGLWAVGVGMMKRSGPYGEDVYVHLANTIAYARVANLDRESVQGLSPEAKALLASKSTGKRRAQHQPAVIPLVKTEDVEDGIGIPGDLSARMDSECVHMLRSRTWWALCLADMLASESLDFAQTVPLGTALQHQPTTAGQFEGEEADLLGRVVDWTENNESSPSVGSRRFGAWARFARVIHHVHTFTGMDGACSAEAAIRAWAIAEGGGDLMSTSGPGLMTPTTSPSVGFQTPAFARSEMMDVDSAASPSTSTSSEDRSQESVQHKAEVALLANRAVLRVWMSWMAYNQPTGTAAARVATSSIPMQAVYGAVGAAFGVIQACRALQSIPISVQAATLPLLADTTLRAVFDAGVVCAHAVLRYPIAVFAAGARDALATGLAVLKSRTERCHGQVEAIRVLEGLAGARGGVGGVHDAPLGPGPASNSTLFAPQQPAAKPAKSALDVLREAEGQRDKEAAKERSERKKRTSYPSVGVRVRPGKEMPFSAGSTPPSPLSAGASRKGSAPNTLTSASRVHSHDELPTAYYTPPPVPPPPPSLDMYRSRSSSISQAQAQAQDPQQAQPQPQPHPISIDFSSAAYSVPAPRSAPLEDFSQRSFGELPPSTTTPQGYGDAMYTDLPSARPPTAFETDAYGHGGGQSPFGSSQSNSPYATTSVVFGSQHPSPPHAYSQPQPQPPPPPPQSQPQQQTQYYSSYDPGHGQSQYEMAGGVGVGVGASYEMKPRQYHVEQESTRLDMAWPPPPDAHAHTQPHSQFWAPQTQGTTAAPTSVAADGYKYYPQ